MRSPISIYHVVVFFPLLWLLQVPTNSSTESAETLIRRVMEEQANQQEVQRHFEFIETTVTKNLRKDGTTIRARSESYSVTPYPSEDYYRLISKNGRALTQRNESKEKQKLHQYQMEQSELSVSEKSEAAREKIKERANRYRERLEQALEAFVFESLPDELMDGQQVKVFRFKPKAQYKGHSIPTRAFARSEGTIWIDKTRNQLAKLDIRVREDLKFLGGIFGRISKGSYAIITGTLQENIRLFKTVEMSLDERMYFLKRYRQHIAISYENYKKLKTIPSDSKNNLHSR